jgi:hypothetical protein
MKYAVEMGSGAMMYSFVTIGSAIQKLTGGIHRQTDGIVISQACFNFSE